jgi:hypothetical protein
MTTRSSSPSTLLQGLCLVGRLVRGSVVGKGLSASVRLDRTTCHLAAAPSLRLELSSLRSGARRLLGSAIGTSAVKATVIRTAVLTAVTPTSIANLSVNFLRSISRSIYHPLLIQGT